MSISEVTERWREARQDSQRRRPADRWARLFGEIAIYSFVVVLLTGVFLTFFYDPDMGRVQYDGSYDRLRGVTVSHAYESTVRLSLEVQGGLLMRQIHHWASLILIAAICLWLLRTFLTGAYRRPRSGSWLIWVTLLLAAMAAGVTGTILPDDMLSGGSLGLIQGVTQSIPVAGTWLTLLVFGGDFPGDAIIPRAYWLHIAVIPVAMTALLVMHRRLVRRYGHPRLSGARVARPAQGAPASAAMFLFTSGLLALLGGLAQINPVWLYGPFEPGAISAGSVPGWYMGFLDGAIRIMPGWEVDVFGQTLTLAVLVPALVVPGLFFTVLALYPWLERRATGDRRAYDVLERPRDAATRTAIGAAGIAFYGVLWAAAANDQIAVQFHLPLYEVTWFFRIAVFAGPVLAFLITQRLCLGLTGRERREAEHGYETGRIVMSPDGGFREIHAPVEDASERRVLTR